MPISVCAQGHHHDFVLLYRIREETNIKSPTIICKWRLTAAAAAEVGYVDIFVIAPRDSYVVEIQGPIGATAILLLLRLLLLQNKVTERFDTYFQHRRVRR